MKKVFVYMVYGVMETIIYKLLDSDIDMVTEWHIRMIALETFQRLGKAIFLFPEQIEECCTTWLGYSLDEFVSAVMRSVSEEDNDLFERAEHIAELKT